jgi:hypothetical protein
MRWKAGVYGIQFWQLIMKLRNLSHTRTANLDTHRTAQRLLSCCQIQ